MTTTDTEQTFPAPRVQYASFRDLPMAREGHITYDQGDEAEDNANRASAGLVAIRAYSVTSYGGGFEEVETCFADLLGDLMHAADALGVEFETVMSIGRRNYEAELRGEL